MVGRIELGWPPGEEWEGSASDVDEPRPVKKSTANGLGTFRLCKSSQEVQRSVRGVGFTQQGIQRTSSTGSTRSSGILKRREKVSESVVLTYLVEQKKAEGQETHPSGQVLSTSSPAPPSISAVQLGPPPSSELG